MAFRRSCGARDHLLWSCLGSDGPGGHSEAVVVNGQYWVATCHFCEAIGRVTPNLGEGAPSLCAAVSLVWRAAATVADDVRGGRARG